MTHTGCSGLDWPNYIHVRHLASYKNDLVAKLFFALSRCMSCTIQHCTAHNLYNWRQYIINIVLIARTRNDIRLVGSPPSRLKEVAKSPTHKHFTDNELFRPENNYRKSASYIYFRSLSQAKSLIR